MKKVDHPAKFTSAQIEQIASAIAEEFGEDKGIKILDPYAGIGGVHKLQEFGHFTFGIEIEREWPGQHRDTAVGDSHVFMAANVNRNKYDAVVTSYVFPNRMTDHHDAKDGSKRHSYKHYLGRDPAEGSSATLGWGKKWRQFHREGFRLMSRVVKKNGLIIIDSKNCYKQRELVLANEWTIRTLAKMGMPLLQVRPVFTRGLTHGQNHEDRVDRHLIIVVRNAK
jgi:hypothetical protein